MASSDDGSSSQVRLTSDKKTPSTNTEGSQSRKKSLANGGKSAAQSVGNAFMSFFAAKTPCAMKNEMIPDEEGRPRQ